MLRHNALYQVMRDHTVDNPDQRISDGENSASGRCDVDLRTEMVQVEGAGSGYFEDEYRKVKHGMEIRVSPLDRN